MSERENPVDVLERIIRNAGLTPDEESLKAARELVEAKADWDNACEMDSGDEFSYDALSAYASNLHQAERKVVTAVCSTWAASVRGGGDPRAELEACLDTLPE